MPQLHALLIGINEYHPDSNVGSLRGCVNDIQDFSDFLEKSYPTLNPVITKLFNEKATYQNVIDNFESKLIEAPKAGDTVIFNYSGHGSQLNSADDFLKYDAKDLDQTMVCYDSRLDDGFDIADKELAAMISSIKEGVTVIVILDSCHSGTATRSVEHYTLGKSRFTSGHTRSRELSTYYKGFYSRMQATTNNITIPKREHILLAACDREEVAWETPNHRGAFSSSLLSVLKKDNYVSYADLFVQLRSYIKKYSSRQTPQFEPIGYFDVNEQFITGEASELTNRIPLLYTSRTNRWFFEQGAVHGLPTDAIDFSKITINVYKKGEGDVLTTGNIDDVKLNFSNVVMVDDVATDASLEAELSFLPNPSVYVLLEGLDADIATFGRHYQPSALIGITQDRNAANYILKISSKQIAIHRKDDDELVHGVEELSEASVEYIVDTLLKIEHWERTFNVNNPRTTISDDDVEIIVETIEEDKSTTEHIGEYLNFQYKKDRNGRWRDIPYNIYVRNNMRMPMHVAVFYMDDDFRVEKIENKLVPAEAKELIFDDGSIFIEDERVDFDKDFFKVFISSEAIDDTKLEQKPLEKKIVQLQGENRAIRRRYRAPQWRTKVLELNVTRNKTDIGESPVSLLNGQITIQPNSTLKADIGFMAVSAKTRSADNTNLLPKIFNDKTTSIINFGSGTRSTEDKSVLVFSNIKGERNLKDEPLEMTINQELAENEYILPITFDGEFIIPVGDVHKDANGNTQVKISELPNVETTSDPNAEQSRSAVRAFKLAFMKLALRKSGKSLFMLRKGDWDENGEFHYDEEADLAAEVAKASKIMMFVHGIIGETKASVQEMEFAKKEFGYDLVLTFDYENLNSDIVEIATNLKTLLNNVGILPNDGKHFDIIVHSLGGLVSRTMLEKLGGHTFVDNLIMFGTPNGGSRFGKIVDYQNFAIMGLTVAMNIFKPLTAHLGGLLFGLKTFKNLTTTLGQMRRDSDFIKGLYENEVGQLETKYHVIAADMTEYLAQGDSKIAKFMDSAMVRTGNTVYAGIKNDIAVATEDILKIPASRNTNEYVVAGHHMNYFILEKPMQILRDIMKNADAKLSTNGNSKVIDEPTGDDGGGDDEIIPISDKKPSIKITSTSKSVLITGASTGIGYSCVQEFLKAGYLVFGSVRKQVDADRLLKELGDNFVPLIFDVTDQIGIKAAVAEVEKHLNGKGLGGLINNAGIAYGGVIQYQPMEHIEQQFDVNVLGLLRVTKAFLPLLGAQENFTTTKGKIINISSVSGKIAFPFVGAYVGTKHAVEGISDSLRRELLFWGIDVIIVGPGAIRTPIWDKGIVDMSNYNDTPYSKIVNRFAKFMLKSGAKGLTPEYLAQRIFKIFEKKKPKARYSIVPGNNFINFTLPTWLPTRWLDNMMGKQTGLKQ